MMKMREHTGCTNRLLVCIVTVRDRHVERERGCGMQRFPAVLKPGPFQSRSTNH